MKKTIFLLLLFMGFTTLQAQKTNVNATALVSDASQVEIAPSSAVSNASRIIEANNFNFMPPGPVPEILYYNFDEVGGTVTNDASAPPAGAEMATINGQSQGVPAICDAGSLQGIGGGSGTNFVDTKWVTY